MIYCTSTTLTFKELKIKKSEESKFTIELFKDERITNEFDEKNLVITNKRIIYFKKTHLYIIYKEHIESINIFLFNGIEWNIYIDISTQSNSIEIADDNTKKIFEIFNELQRFKYQ